MNVFNQHQKTPGFPSVTDSDTGSFGWYWLSISSAISSGSRLAGCIFILIFMPVEATAQQSMTFTVSAAAALPATIDGLVCSTSSNKTDVLFDPFIFPAGATITSVSAVTITWNKPHDDLSLPCGGSPNRSWPDELFLALVAPGGTQRIMVNHGSYDSAGDSFNNITTIFEDSATSTVVGTSPVTGTFDPIQLFSAFNGTDPSGTWRLRIGDNFWEDPFTVTSATLTVTAAVPFADYGDLPATYDGNNPTTAAWHGVSTSLYLGPLSADADGTPPPWSAVANGDDTDTDGDEEDGVSTFQAYIPAGGMMCTGDNGTYTTAANEYCVVVEATNTSTSDAQLVGWLDYGAGNSFIPDGTFSDAERSLPCLGGTGTGVMVSDSGGATACSGTVLGAGNQTFTMGNIKAGFTGDVILVFTGLGDDGVQTGNQTYARFRITTDSSFFSGASPSPTGAVIDGEVEDFVVDFGTLPVTLSHFDSTLVGKKLDIDWGTSSELFNVGFQLWGMDGIDGQWTKLHNRLIQSGSGNAVEPQSYSKRVRIPRAIEQLTAVGISSVDSDGSEHYYGPFEMGQAYGDLAQLEPIEWNHIRAEVDGQMARNGYVKDQGSGYRKVSLSGESTVSGSSATDQVVEFKINEDGLYRITADELLNAGLDWRDIANGEIALLDHAGHALVRYVLAKGKGRGLSKTLGANGEIYFYGQTPEESDGLYTDSSVYRLVLDGAKALDAPTQGKQGLKDGFGDQYIDYSVVENDAHYIFRSAADDPWVSRVVVGYTDQPSLYGIQVPVEADALLDQPSTLLLGLGRSSHLSGVDSDNDGVQDVEHIVEGLAIGADNQLLSFGQHSAVGAGLWDVAFEIPGDTPLALSDGHAVIGGGFSAGAGYAFSEVHVDSIGLAYARPAIAKAGEDHLLFSAPNDGKPGYDVTVPNYGSAIVFASDGANLVRIMPESAKKGRSADGESQRVVKFAALQGIENVAEGGELKYWVSAKEKVLRVAGLSSRTIPTQANLLAQAQGSDYVLIAHPTFIGEDSSGVDHLSSYVAFKRSQGYTVSMINYLDIVDAFGGGQAGPWGLTRYLSTLEAHQDIEHILIVGGSTYDHTDSLGTGAITFIPGHYGPSRYSNYTLSDVPYIQNTNTQALFAAIGRWPVRTMGDLGHIVNKSLVWGQSDHSVGETLLIAENTLAGENIDFGAALDTVAGTLPLDWTTNKVYVDEILSANPGMTQAQAFTQARGEIVGHLNAVPELVLFNGHADTRQLSNNGLFKSSHIAQVTTPGAEIWLPMSCYVTYYESTHVNTLAHQLLFTGNAVAITGSMLLSDQAGNIAMGQSILGGVFVEDQTLGAAVNQGKVQINNPQLDINWALLGDPTVSF